MASKIEGTDERGRSNDGGPDNGEKISHPGPERPHLTKDELRVLKECNNESFWYRCVPLAVTFSFGTQLLIQRGFFSSHPKYGSFGKHFAAVLSAYMLGKLSYQTECKKKIMQLENSPLAESLRRNRLGGAFPSEKSADDIKDEAGIEGGVTLSDQYPRRDIDNRAINLQGLDESLRPSLDRMQGKQPQDSESNVSTHTSYEELRLRNRNTYDKKASVPHTSNTVSPPGTSPEFPAPLSSTTSAYTPPKTNVKRNQYGDVVEE